MEDRRPRLSRTRPPEPQWTVTIAVLLLVEPQEFVTRTQYDVVDCSRDVVYDEDVAPAIGDDVLPDDPMNH